MKKYISIVMIVFLAIITPLMIFSQNTKIFKVIESKCIGCKLCLDECPVDAISMKNGKAVIDTEKCIGCGLCAQACRFDAIVLEKQNKKKVEQDTTKTRQVADSTQKENLIRIFQVLEEKCIGCRICKQKCPTDAIEMIDGKAVINVEKCIQCGICEEVCPVNAIQDTLISPDSLNKKK